MTTQNNQTGYENVKKALLGPYDVEIVLIEKSSRKIELLIRVYQLLSDRTVTQPTIIAL